MMDGFEVVIKKIKQNSKAIVTKNQMAKYYDFYYIKGVNMKVLCLRLSKALLHCKMSPKF